jgi:transaldolase / glucose-6-phosphate isomerase
VLYVEELIGPDTINTMPLATMDAFRDHGKLRASLEPPRVSRRLIRLSHAAMAGRSSIA